MKFLTLSFFCLFTAPIVHAAAVTTTAELLKAVAAAQSGSVVEIGEGKFELSAPLVLKTVVSLKGAGMDKTTVTNAAGWKGNPATLPDPEVTYKKFDKTGYLIHLEGKGAGNTVSDMTLTGPQLHGGIYGFENSGIDLHNLRFDDFMYAGFRGYRISDAKIHDCTFVDAGQRWDKGKPGVKGGHTGGGIFVIWISDSEIYNNRFKDTKKEPNLHFYGIKGRKAKNVRVHHNTIETNFAIEFAHENDENVEIDHNILRGTVSIPKNGGGSVAEGKRSFHVHHNYTNQGYAIEFPRNGAEIDHNLFDCPVEKDTSNFISGFGGNHIDATGPAFFHNNLVSNPGRSVIWNDNAFNGMEVRNNHIITRTGPTKRQEGLLSFSKKTDFTTHVFRDNVVECIGQPRALFGRPENYKAKVTNNKLVNVSDTAHYENLMGDGTPGLEEPLKFRCGVNGEMAVDGWEFKEAK